MKSLLKIFLVLVVLIWAMSGTTVAQWSADSSVNTPITNLSSNQYNAQIASDGAGGAIITWYDFRNATDYDIYAQRIDATGTPKWTTNGVLICGASGSQYSPVIVSDGLGGAIIAWYDYRNGSDYDIYAQKVSGNGLVQWTSNGVPICTASGNQSSPFIVSDGSGGAIIAWYDYRSTTNYDVYAQRVSSSGSVQWTANGVGLCTYSGDQYPTSMAADGSGGAIVAWYDYRSASYYDIYAQRVSASGSVQWGTYGAPVCTFYNKSKYVPIVASDGAGGAIIAWYDYRSDTAKVYAQRMNSAGSPQWTTNGIPISPTPNYQFPTNVEPDGAGGAIIIWNDLRNGSDYDIYAQRVNSSGTALWTSTGVPICTAPQSQSVYNNYGAIPDGAGGAIVTWTDYRQTYPNIDIYAQDVNASGTTLWGQNGVAVSGAPNIQASSTVALSSPGNAIITWNDYRSTNYSNIYAQFISSSGKRLPAPQVTSTPPATIPANQALTLSATITSSTSITGAALYYRRGGESSFFSTPMVKVGATYQDSVPSTYITSKGAEYYIIVNDSVGNVTRAPSSGVIPLQVTVAAPGVAGLNPQPAGTAQTAYRLVSVPINADTKTPQAVLTGALGAYDNTKWRFYELKADQSYAELPGTSNMDPGKAFWLIVGAGSPTLTSGSGKTIVTNSRYAVGLNPGWTFVGDPFYFPIPLNKLTLKSGGAPDLRYFTGSWATASTAMQPFEGFAVANNNPSVDTLFIDPVLTPAPAPGMRQSGSATAEQQLWTVRIAARAEEAVDNDNAIVVSPAASLGLDALDRPKPPMIGEYVSVDFPHPSWGAVFKYYSTDARPEPKTGDAWGFEVRSNIRDRVDLTFSGIASVPAKFEVWLVDNALKTTTNLRSSSMVSFNNAGVDQPHEFTVFIGTAAYVRQKLDEFAALPTSYELNQNFPNPFNPTTTIRYALPAAGHVTLKIFDLLGQEVRTLVDGLEPQGYHTAEFNASDLSSGIYYYRITVDAQAEGGSGSSHQFVQTMKLILLK